MAYQRKTKDVYRIIWNGEVVDAFDTRKEAMEMLKEYKMAYHGGSFSIVAARERIGE